MWSSLAGKSSADGRPSKTCCGGTTGGCWLAKGARGSPSAADDAGASGHDDFDDESPFDAGGRRYDCGRGGAGGSRFGGTFLSGFGASASSASTAGRTTRSRSGR